MRKEVDGQFMDVFQKIENLPKIGGEATVSLRDVCHEFGRDSFVIVLLFFHFLNAIPIPNPLLVFVFGVSSALVAVQAVIGRPYIWLPQFFLNKTIDRKALSNGIAKALPKISFFRSHTKLRLQLLTTNSAIRLFMFISGALSLLMAVVLPLGNCILSVGIVVLCLGLLTKDGFYVVIGNVIALFGVVWAAFVSGGIALVVWMSITNVVTRLGM